MATLKEFRAMFRKMEEHPAGFSNLSVRSHADCPHCKANLLFLWSFYPELFIKYPQGNGGFSLSAVEWYRTPEGEVIQNYKTAFLDGKDGLKKSKPSIIAD